MLDRSKRSVCRQLETPCNLKPLFRHLAAGQWNWLGDVGAGRENLYGNGNEGAMRQGQNNKNRMRGRGNNNNSRKGGNSRNQSFESNGPDVKVRGNAQQIVEKYLTLARDASLAGDRINAESYYQFAEHYYRVMNANAANEQQRQQQQNAVNDPNGEGAQENGADENPKRDENADASSPDAQQDAPRDAKSEGGESNGRSRRRSSRGPRSNGRVKDPAEQPQPDVEVAAEPAELVAEPAVESATDAEVKDAGEGANA